MVYRTGVEAVPRLFIAEQPDLCAKAEITPQGQQVIGLGGLSMGRIVKISLRARLLPIIFK